MFRRLIHTIRNLVRKPALDRDLNEEVAAYEALLAEEHTARGVPPDAARRAARLALEGPDAVKEAVRDVRAGAWLEQCGRDFRYAFRTLVRSPGFTAFTLLTFTVALGGLTVIGSMVNALLLRPLPYARSDQLVSVLETDDDDLVGGYSVAAPNYLDWQAQNRVFSGMALYEYLSSNLTDGVEPEQVGSLRVTGGVFELLGVQPLLGRGLQPADDASGAPIAVMSYGLWQRRYGADSTLVGKTIRVNGVATTVVGVMPKGFGFPSVGQQLWLPIALNAEDRGRAAHSFFAIARLRDGVTVEQARREMRGLGDALAKAYPATNVGETVNVFPLRDLWVQGMRGLLQTLLVAVVLVLAIASANIASLLVARNAARRREIAARMALGGSRSRILRQLMTESTILSLGGTALGIGLAAGITEKLFRLFPSGVKNVPFRDLSNVGLEPIVAVAAVVIALLAGVAAGLLPALTVLPADPAALLRDAGARSTTARHTRRLKSTLVGVEVALALVVVVGAGLLIASIRRLSRVEPGLDPRGVRALELALPQADFYGPAERITLCADLTREVSSVPGVTGVSAVSHVPLSGAGAGRGFGLEGLPDPGSGKRPSASYGVVCPGYFGTLGIPLLSGRDFSPDDRAGAAPVMIVNRALAARYFEGHDPVGRRIKLGGINSDGPWITIVGMVGNVRHNGLAQEAPAYLYAPYAQAAWPRLTVMVRTTPGASVEPIRLALRRAVPADPIGSAYTMEQVVEASLGHVRFPMVLFSVFAAMALALAALGCFGVASQAVVQQRRELGIRLALGARKGQLYRLVIGQAMLPVGFGIVLGGGAAIGFARVLRSLLYDIAPGDPMTLAAGAVVLAGVAVVACLLPARRAAQVDPVMVLREE